MTRVRNGLLTVTATIGALCLLAALAGWVLGVKPLVFTSGSMGPDIPAGAFGLSVPVPAGDLRVGDVVSVITADGTRVTHRVAGVAGTGDTRVLTLRGDANPAPDSETYEVPEADRVFWSAPGVGHVLAFVGSGWGLFLLGGLLFALLAVIVRREPPAGGRHRAARAAVVPVAAATLIAAGTTDTRAAFSDTATASSGAIAAHTVVSQAQPACQNVDGVLVLGNIARVTWTQVHSGYEYAWSLRNAASGTVVSTGTAGTGQALGSTVTVDISTGLIGVNANYDLVVRARLAATPGWVAATTTTTPVRRASVLIIGAAFRCGHA